MDNQEILTYLLGDGSIEQLIAALIYAYVGAFLMLLLNTTKRDPNSVSSPVHFSWKYLWCDNTRRILATFILIFLFIRFSREILGAELTMYLALLIGMASDRLSLILKEKNILGK